MSIFDKWTDLDPALALRRIEAAHGSAIFDVASYLDPARAIAQINATLGTTLGPNDLLNPVSALDDIDAALEEDEEEPDEEYVVAGVHTSGNVMLICDSLTATDNEFFAAACWFKDISGSNGNGILMVADPDNTYENLLTIKNNGNQVSWDAGDGEGNSLQAGYVDDPASGVWHSFIVAINVNFADGLKQYDMYFDKVKISREAIDADDGSSAFSMAFNALKMVLFDDSYGTGVTGDYAELWIAPGQNLLNEDGEIPEATLEAFFGADNAPQYLGENGELPTGTAPAIFLSKNSADETAFTTNRGTGGSFVAHTLKSATGGNGAGARTCTGAQLGATVAYVNNNDTFTYVTEDFESTISVAGQIQQLSGSYAGNSLAVLVTGGSFTEADSSPSDEE